MPRQPDWRLYESYIRSVEHLALRPPRIDPEVPLNYHPEVDDYAMSSGMARTPGGRRWLAWFGNGDNSQTVMLLGFSDDDGPITQPRFIIDPGFVPGGLHMSAVVGNVWCAPDGRLFCFFMQCVGHFDGRGGTWQSVCENPDADEPAWSTPERIWHGAALNKPTVLSDNTWLLPVALWGRHMFRLEDRHTRNIALSEFCQVNGLFTELDERRGSNVLASRDRGRTWEPRGTAVNPHKPIFDEPMVLERGDGGLLMYIRDREGMLASESHDQGWTWSTPQHLPWQCASARFLLRRLRSGAALLVRHANAEDPAVRSHMTAFISRDDGASWEGGLLLDARDRISYPDGYQEDDGLIRVQYDRLRECGEILMASFTEEDALAGRDVSGRVVLRQPLVQSRSARLGLT